MRSDSAVLNQSHVGVPTIPQRSDLCLMLAAQVKDSDRKQENDSNAEHKGLFRISANQKEISRILNPDEFYIFCMSEKK